MITANSQLDLKNTAHDGYSLQKRAANILVGNQHRIQLQIARSLVIFFELNKIGANI